MKTISRNSNTSLSFKYLKNKNVFKRFALLLFIVPIVTIAACTQHHDPLGDLMEMYATKGSQKGIKSPFNGAVLVAKNDKIIFKKAYGYSNRKTKTLNTVETIYPIASITKQFTAMLVMQLVENGQLRLDDNISKHLTYFSKTLGDSITIHQLLSHTSGLPHYEGLTAIGLDEETFSNTVYTTISLTELIGETRLICEPGTAYNYSSLGYILLGAIIEDVTGNSFSEMLDRSIAEPLGLKNTGFESNEFIKNNAAKGYRFNELYGLKWLLAKEGGEILEAPFRDQSTKYSTGGLHSTIDDLFVWSQAIRNNSLLSSELTQKMLTPVLDGYCYGWIRNWDDLVERNTNVRMYTHGGALSGYRSSITLFDDGTTVIYLSNLSPLKETELIHQIYLATHQLEDEFRIDGYPNRSSLSKFESQGGIPALNNYFKELSNYCGYEVLPSENSIKGIMYLYLKNENTSIADSLKNAFLTHYRPSESALNKTGYYFLEEEECEYALGFFRENVKRHPYSANTWDSQGEGLMICGERDKAIESFSKAVELAELTNNKSLDMYKSNLKKAQGQLNAK